MVLVENQDYLSQEEQRLKEDRERKRYWKKWGSYVAERQWATGKHFPRLSSRPPLSYANSCLVREDYS